MIFDDWKKIRRQKIPHDTFYSNIKNHLFSTIQQIKPKFYLHSTHTLMTSGEEIIFGESIHP